MKTQNLILGYSARRLKKKKDTLVYLTRYKDIHRPFAQEDKSNTQTTYNYSSNYEYLIL